jgi:hypothetical protein
LADVGFVAAPHAEPVDVVGDQPIAAAAKRVTPHDTGSSVPPPPPVTYEISPPEPAVLRS